MPRKPLEKSAYYPYHVCNRSIDQNFYPTDMASTWELSCDLLRILSWTYDAKIHAYVLMSNHYHLLVSTPSENLFDCIRYFQTEFSKWLRQETGKQNFRFGGRYKYSIIKQANYYSNVYRYIYQNPVRAGLCKQAEEYPYSTLSGKVGRGILNCPLAPHDYDGLIPGTESEALKWLNSVFDSNELTRIQRGLRKATYCPPRRIYADVQKVGVRVER